MLARSSHAGKPLPSLAAPLAVPPSRPVRRLTRRGIVSVAILVATQSAATSAQSGSDRRTHDWMVAPGFRLDVAADGFSLPSAIAFVRNPGRGPNDPRYFVTELRGTVKVVTNDGSVLTFASGFTRFKPSAELPAEHGENGTAGLCLDPPNGYVFVTFVYSDSMGVLRNSIARFKTVPITFSATPTDQVVLSEIFARDASYLSHQIGPCVVRNGALFVAVGDAEQVPSARDLDRTTGKILRMTVDGDPIPTNPYYSAHSRKARSYVWASGFRNVFGLTLVGARLFATENGNDIDRFFEIERGKDYLFQGSDWSIGLNALAVFAPAVCPTTLVFNEGLSALPSPFPGRFFAALTGAESRRGTSLSGANSIVALDYDFHRNRMEGPPTHYVRYRGSGYGAIVAMALGTDGLYFAPLLGDSSKGSPIFRVSYSPHAEHSFVIGRDFDGATLIQEKGCSGCHRIGNAPGGSAGPPLQMPDLQHRLEARLHSDGFVVAARARMDRADDSTRATLREILDASGNERIRRWVKGKIRRPRLESDNAAMPSLGMGDAEASAIADYLLDSARVAPRKVAARGLGPAREAVSARLPKARWLFVGLSFLAGGFLSAVLFRRSRRKRTSRSGWRGTGSDGG